jgi:SPFH domain / Band 7 family
MYQRTGLVESSRKPTFELQIGLVEYVANITAFNVGLAYSAIRSIRYSLLVDADSIWPTILFGGIMILYFLLRRLRRTKYVFVSDYQRGVRFVGGVFRDVVRPGSYRIYSPNEQITVVDTRPHPFVIERLLYQDALQNPSVISIGAELLISDPYLSLTKLQDAVNDSVPVVREVLRSLVARSIADASAGSRTKMGEEIAKAVDNELRQSGMRISNVEITELWCRPLQQSGVLGAN